MHITITTATLRRNKTQ